MLISVIIVYNVMIITSLCDYYGIHVCVSPNPHVDILSLMGWHKKVWTLEVFESWNGILMDGINSFTSESRRRVFFAFVQLCEYTAGWCPSRNQETRYHQIENCWYLDLEFWEINACCLRHSVHGALAKKGRMYYNSN
jgi:hypothetical protein